MSTIYVTRRWSPSKGSEAGEWIEHRHVGDKNPCTLHYWPLGRPNILRHTPNVRGEYSLYAPKCSCPPLDGGPAPTAEGGMSPLAEAPSPICPPESGAAEAAAPPSTPESRPDFLEPLPSSPRGAAAAALPVATATHAPVSRPALVPQHYEEGAEDDEDDENRYHGIYSGASGRCVCGCGEMECGFCIDVCRCWPGDRDY
jgi:hypothetical protein